MLAIIVKGTKLEIEHILDRSYPEKSLFEFRLDLMDREALNALSELIQKAQLPIILTLRSVGQGGQFEGGEKERLELLFCYLSLKIDYVDLEFDIDPAFAQKVKNAYPKTRIIASFHDFKKTPKDLDQVFEEMQRFSADIYKICTYAQTTIDSLRMLDFIQKKRKEKKAVAGMCMGPFGAATRILAPIVDSVLTYISSENQDNLMQGNVTLKDLVEVYHYNRLDTHTAIYALLGNPVEASIGHLMRNRFFFEKKIDAVYVKLEINPGDLPHLFPLIKRLPFKGFSVTMPLKEYVGAYMDSIDSDAKEIGAINTIGLSDGKWVGYNTDGRGAILAIGKKIPIAKSCFLIFGAGGAAKAVAYSLFKKGGRVTIINRDVEKARVLAQKVNGKYGGFNSISAFLKQGFDVIINATSIGMTPKEDKKVFDGNSLDKKTLVFDLVYKPKDTRLIKDAKRAGCRVIFGIELYAYQEALQLEICLGKGLNLDRTAHAIVDFNDSLDQEKQKRLI